MAEIHGRLGPLLACHVIQRLGPQSHPGMLAPGPVRLRPPGTAHGRRTADCQSRSQSAWLVSHDLDPQLAPFVHADLKRE